MDFDRRVLAVSGIWQVLLSFTLVHELDLLTGRVTKRWIGRTLYSDNQVFCSRLRVGERRWRPFYEACCGWFLSLEQGRSLVHDLVLLGNVLCKVKVTWDVCWLMNALYHLSSLVMMSSMLVTGVSEPLKYVLTRTSIITRTSFVDSVISVEYVIWFCREGRLFPLGRAMPKVSLYIM